MLTCSTINARLRNREQTCCNCLLQVPVEEWRGRLWARALADQGVNDTELGDMLQQNFTSARTLRFKFAPDVAVRTSFFCIAIVP